MIEFSLLVLALLCINMAVYSVQRKSVDEQLKDLEKDMLDIFKDK